jgi:uncharacterized cupin superfamily protein
LGEAGRLRDIGVNLMRLPLASGPSQRHWHGHEDGFVDLLEGEVTLIEDGGETVLRAGDCATFPKGTGNGHHRINNSSAMSVYLEVGSRNPHDLTTCSDIDMVSSNADGRFVHKDGRPCSKSKRSAACVVAAPSEGSLSLKALPSVLCCLKQRLES